MDHLFRLTLCVVVLLAATVAPSLAHAACTGTGSNRYCLSHSEAISGAKAACNPGTGAVAWNVYSAKTNVTLNGIVYVGAETPVRKMNSTGAIVGCTAIYSGHGTNFYWPDGVEDTCSDKVGQTYQSWNATSTWPPSPTGCGSASNCEVNTSVLSAPTSDPGAVYWYRSESTYTGQECGPEDADTNESEEEDAGDGWTCNAATGLCTDPSGNGKLCTFNPDGSRSNCVDYEPGDETSAPPTPESDNEDGDNDPRNDERVSTGGGSCDVPPTCSGDAIDCATQWQQWKTRCALERAENAATGGACVAGAGASALNCSSMTASQCATQQLMQEAACRLADIAANTGEDGPAGGGSTSDGGVDTSGMGDPNDFGDGATSAADAWRPGVGEEGGPDGVEDFDDAGWLSSRSCPQLPVVAVLGTTLDFNAHAEKLCWFLGIGSQLVLLFAALSSIRIVSRVI